MGYTDLFCVAVVTSVYFETCDNVLGDSLESIKPIKAPYVFGGEQGIVLHAMQRYRASSHGEGEVSYIFSGCGWNVRYILELQ